MSEDRKFRILSIDGGGIRGIIPAKVLEELEAQIQREQPGIKLHQYFDLICGTSTGAILAIGIALGIPAKDIVKFYVENAKIIFPKWYLKILPRESRIFLANTIYTNKELKAILNKTFTDGNNGITPLLNDLKTNVCIPSFNGNLGEINVLKTKHHQDYIRDYKLPAHEVALSSASAPVYFPPNSFRYDNEHGSGANINMIDGGIFANNPALIGIFEATDKLGHDFSNIKVLSLGTGKGKHIIKKSWLPKNFFYWFIPKPRLLEITLDSQSQITEQYILFLQRTIARNQKSFDYLRVQHDFGKDVIDLNVSKAHDLQRLESVGGELSKKYMKDIVEFLKKEENQNG
jgi:patatin-like phospholipase/acyl hydrolase